MLLGCSDSLPPRGQVLLYIDTDAVLPPPEGSPPEPLLAPLPLFDRLTVEIFAPGEDAPCAGCLREFVIDRSHFGAEPPSVGIAPPPGEAGYRARIRLFRARAAHAEVSLETTVALPEVEEEGIVEAHVVLRTDDVGVPIGSLDAPIDPLPGRAFGSLAGSWPGAERRDCVAPPLPGEVCVPGGAFWMGERDLVGSAHDGDRERLVVVSPFYIDATELTVEAARAAGLTPQPWSGSYGQGVLDWCTYTAEPGPHDARPVNCISWQQAEDHCASRGGALPTEAQWEYVARALGKRRYSWGLDPPRCADAVWGFGLPPLEPVCPIVNVVGGPLPPGSGPRDRLELPGGVIVDLAANLREWTRDVWNAQDEACWTPAGVRWDPVCALPGALGPDQRSVRGDGFHQNVVVISAAARTYDVLLSRNPFTGLRCARPAG